MLVKKRTNNQDFVNHFVNRSGMPLIVLADGMGGHRAGNIASEMAVTGRVSLGSIRRLILSMV